jgi:hypothetical protein
MGIPARRDTVFLGERGMSIDVNPLINAAESQ